MTDKGIPSTSRLTEADLERLLTPEQGPGDETIVRGLTRESQLRDRDLARIDEKRLKLWVWWARMSDKYPYQVEVPLSLVRDENLPELLDDPVYGAHIMAHLRPSWRTYGFMERASADAFIRKYPQRAKHFQWGQGSSGLVI